MAQAQLPQPTPCMRRLWRPARCWASPRAGPEAGVASVPCREQRGSVPSFEQGQPRGTEQGYQRTLVPRTGPSPGHTPWPWGTQDIASHLGLSACGRHVGSAKGHGAPCQGGGHPLWFSMFSRGMWQLATHTGWAWPLPGLHHGLGAISGLLQAVLVGPTQASLPTPKAPGL